MIKSGLERPKSSYDRQWRTVAAITDLDGWERSLGEEHGCWRSLGAFWSLRPLVAAQCIVGRLRRGGKTAEETAKARRPCHTWEGVSPRRRGPPDEERCFSRTGKLPTTARAFSHRQGRPSTGRAPRPGVLLRDQAHRLPRPVWAGAVRPARSGTRMVSPCRASACPNAEAGARGRVWRGPWQAGRVVPDAVRGWSAAAQPLPRPRVGRALVAPGGVPRGGGGRPASAEEVSRPTPPRGEAGGSGQEVSFPGVVAWSRGRCEGRRAGRRR